MSRLIESICILNGKVRNLNFHQKRMDDSVLFLFNHENQINLSNIISKIKFSAEGKFKLRILYSDEIEQLELIPYKIREIQSFRLVADNHIEYSNKYEDRSAFEKLKNSTKADEVIILKNGLITDTSFSNLIFWDGRKWLTPKSPLLKGVMREQLLSSNEICQSDISADDLNSFLGFKLINAMMSFDESPLLNISIIQK